MYEHGVTKRFCLLVLLIACCCDAVAGEPASLLEAGRRLYQEGVLPNGEPMVAMRPEGFEIEGRYAACMTCHRRSGMGSIEGLTDSTVLVPPIAGPVLFAPARFADSFLDYTHHYVPNEAWRRALKRPAYDTQSLARAMRTGLDPGGERLVPPMPLYNLDDEAITALDAYLKQLSSEASEGIEEAAIHIATVITPDVSKDRADAVIGVLKAWSRMARGAGKPWRLQVWRLSGPPAGWRAQLDARYQQQPVFALLSGIGGAEWAPVHEFCEQRSLACVLPSVDVVPDPQGDHYSVYYSRGVELEAGILARHLQQVLAEPDAQRRIVQLYSDASGEHAARLLAAGLAGSKLAGSKAQTIVREYESAKPLAAVRDVNGEDVLVLWLRADEIMQLVAARPHGLDAGAVYLSSLLAAPDEIRLPANWKRRLHFVSLFDDHGVQGEIARLRLQRWLATVGLGDNGNRRLQADAYAASFMLNEAFGEIRDQELRRPEVPFTREHVLEVLETLIDKYDDSTGLVTLDSHVAYYGRMSLGPRQRVAVRGGTIMRYQSVESGKLAPVGNRIVP